MALQLTRRSPASRCSAAARRSAPRARVVVRAETSATSEVAGVVNDDTWEELVLHAKVPVLVDFWAPWCGPCRMIAPLIDELAGEFNGRALCFKLNTDDSPGVATELGIRSIPTVMIFDRGQKQETIIGAVPKSTLLEALERFT